MMTYNHEREIDWQAFLYVSGEMSPAEAETFEDQLAHDQEAREAVAAAVKLVGRLAASRPAETRALAALPVADRTTRKVAAAATIAASLLVCWSLVRHSPGPANPSGEDARQLISYWSAAWSPGDNGSADSIADDEESEVGVPSWMLAAVEPAPPKATEEN
jgi:hypothetical protein